MVLVGLSILVISFSCLIYRYRPSALPRSLLLWSGNAKSKERALDSAEGDEKNDVEKEKTSIPKLSFDNGESTKAKPETTHKSTTENSSEMNRSPITPTLSLPNQAVMPETGVPKPRAQNEAQKSPASLMPPPPRPIPKPSSPKALPKPSTALRPPPSAASTLRAPASSSLKPSNNLLAPSTSTLAPSNRPSRKVLLDPGHSPLDWAHLTANPPTPTFLRGDDVPPNLIRVPPSALRYHSGRKGKNAWGVYQGRVYNLTPYMKFHPGGVDQLMRGAGKEKDGENLFNEIHPWINWENMLGECMVGILVSEEEGQIGVQEKESKMDEMD